MDHEFFSQAFVYLAAAVLIVPLAKKLGMGSVLGYLLSGIIIGPYVLGFVGREGQDIMHVAEFGVVMMLFLVGLELEPSRLWRLRSSILGLGGLQVLGTSLLLAIPGSSARTVMECCPCHWNDPFVVIHCHCFANYDRKGTDAFISRSEFIFRSVVPGHGRDSDPCGIAPFVVSACRPG